jgi:hypothetical protein
MRAGSLSGLCITVSRTKLRHLSGGSNSSIWVSAALGRRGVQQRPLRSTYAIRLQPRWSFAAAKSAATGAERKSSARDFIAGATVLMASEPSARNVRKRPGERLQGYPEKYAARTRAWIKANVLRVQAVARARYHQDPTVRDRAKERMPRSRAVQKT